MAPGEALRRLQPLLAPRSVAVVGASPKEGSFGRASLCEVKDSGFAGALWAVNPNYRDILGTPCFPRLADLPEAPDLAVLAIANPQVEEAVDAAIAAGAKAAVIFASCYLEGDGDPPLTERLRRKARESALLVCGANCLGFHNRDHRLRVGVFQTGSPRPGPIAVISHSGSAYLAMAMIDPRFGCNLIVSAGQELAVTAADYLAYALDMPTTRTVALFLETVRDPEGFRAGLARANVRDVPVVALKVGRTERSARLAQTHSGALAGNDAAYEALFDAYGVRRVESVDELTATAQLMASPRRYVSGGLGAVLDSGGQRGMMIDLAAKLDLPIAEIGPATRARLAAVLEYGLAPVNPVDAWGTGRNAEAVFGESLKALAADPAVGAVALFSDIMSEDPVSEAMFGGLLDAYAATDKPVMQITNWSRVPETSLHLKGIARGLPVLDGTQNGLAALAHARAYGRFRALPPPAPPPPPAAAAVERWRARLSTGVPLDEPESLGLVADFGIGVPAWRLAGSRSEALAAAKVLGTPVVLKTAAPGIRHKSDVDGVRVGLRDECAVAAAYDDIAGRLGPRVLVMAMAAGVEFALGLVHDPQFGPVVMVGAGGVLVEVLEDRRFLLPPIDRVRAERAIERLRAAKLLAGVRGRPPADRGALADAVARLGALADALGDAIAEVDVNPLLVGASGAVAVDALVLPRPAG
jgi:acyl-CoA synthetase (NDP forming)